MKIHFTDFFEVAPATLEDYGAFNISLINDLPLFIDPFLLFGSSKPEYQRQHQEILKYLTFLRDRALEGPMSKGELESWYSFSEVKQNWLGFSKQGNSGQGLGPLFGKAMSTSITVVFDDLGKEIIPSSSHLEKVGLFQMGVGKDNISDFTTNLIKDFLLTYTQSFAQAHLEPQFVRKCTVDKAYFDYGFGRWMSRQYVLPYINGDYVILTPRDLLTKEENWINSRDLRNHFDGICNGLTNAGLREAVNHYFRGALPNRKDKRGRPVDPTQQERAEAIQRTIHQFPELVKWYIKLKEENKVTAKASSKKKVKEVEDQFIQAINDFVQLVNDHTEFYTRRDTNAWEEANKRVQYLKDVIEHQDGYRAFYHSKGDPISQESILQLMFRLTWFAADYDANREVNNGRGPADYVVSFGAKDKSVVEFKLAKNRGLKDNLEHQTEIYAKANNTQRKLKVVLYFDNSELARVNRILKELKLESDPTVVLIDARKKQSASKVKTR